MWVNKQHPLAEYVDVRAEVLPGVQASVALLPFPDQHFDIAVFDPPHGNLGRTTKLAQRYGSLTTRQIREMVSGAGPELHRVVRAGGILVLKWSDRDMSLATVLRLLPQWEPLFGHGISSHATRAHTIHWLLLTRREP